MVCKKQVKVNVMRHTTKYEYNDARWDTERFLCFLRLSSSHFCVAARLHTIGTRPCRALIYSFLSAEVSGVVGGFYYLATRVFMFFAFVFFGGGYRANFGCQPLADCVK